MGQSDKLRTINKLHQIVLQAESNFTPQFDIQEIIEQERRDSWKYDGRTVMGKAQKPDPNKPGIQLSLF
ncbi:hypothetical protein D3C87_1825440 [compost metagenome]